MPSLRPFQALRFLLAVTSAGVLQIASAKTVTHTYKHFKDNNNVVINLDVEPGDTIDFTIAETCPDTFEYTTIALEATGTVGVFSRADNCKATGSKTINFTAEAQYSGYIIQIDPKAGLAFMSSNDAQCTVESATCKTAKSLRLALIFDGPWNVELAGGFSVSDLVSPKYGSRAATINGVTQNLIVRDADAEDDQSLGLVGIIHVGNRQAPRWAGSFGLGVNESNKTNYYLGASFRAGGQWFVTLGTRWGPVERLKTGTQVGDVLADPKDLVDLPTRTDKGVFIALSYSFLNPGKSLFSGGFAEPPKK